MGLYFNLIVKDLVTWHLNLKLTEKQAAVFLLKFHSIINILYPCVPPKMGGKTSDKIKIMPMLKSGSCGCQKELIMFR